MPVTYDNLASTSSTNNNTTVSFTNINQNFTDLVLMINAKNTSGTNNGQIVFNSDTSANYSGVYLQFSSTAGGDRVTNTTNLYTPEFSSGDFSSCVVNIMNYSNNQYDKTVIQRGGEVSERTALWVNTWRSPLPITRIDLSTFGGNWATGSTFALYGIKAA